MLSRWLPLLALGARLLVADAGACPPSPTDGATAPSSSLNSLVSTWESVDFRAAKDEFERDRSARLKDLSDERHAPLLLDHGHPTEYAVVITHGLYDSPDAHRELARFFHEKGMNVVVPLLPKHWERRYRHLDSARDVDYIAEQEKAVGVARRMGKKLILIGHSTGGLLALRQTLRDPSVAATILFAPAIELTPSTLFMARAGKLLGIDGNFDGRPDGVSRTYISPAAGVEVGHLVDRFHRENRMTGLKVDRALLPKENRYYRELFGRIRTPIVVVTSKEDDTISNEAVDRAFRASAGPKLDLWVTGIGHAGVGRAWPGETTPKDDDSPELRVKKRHLKDMDGFLAEQLPGYE